ncbi:50S ribosomal protein L20 [Candidatus Phytoplasma luffae]|uniref:Large ribosomal subunit protein bL20 n=1 Tax=Loofah witches'-broom phytoplasma TaxID=35773 RepID=A0A975IM97_LOWBP|nr:50S ribosomal protein L20 [Candidatus Phytoplasma luffae]QTX03203.1 50S ribosomal protein L20 [Candidatus Phytoplasma luffae]
MVKVNFVAARHKRRKKILKLAKGYFGSKSKLYKTANEQVMRSLQYAYRDRRQKKRNFRKLWITRINAGCVNNGMRYSSFIHGLTLAKVDINRKILSDLSYNEPHIFTDYINLAKKTLEEHEAKIQEKIKQTLKQQQEEQQQEEQQEFDNQEVNTENILINSKDKEIKKNNLETKKIKQKIDNKENLDKEKNKDIEKKLKKYLLSELKELAQKYEIKNISKLKKIELINILKDKMINQSE